MTTLLEVDRDIYENDLREEGELTVDNKLEKIVKT